MELDVVVTAAEFDKLKTREHRYVKKLASKYWDKRLMGDAGEYKEFKTLSVRTNAGLKITVPFRAIWLTSALINGRSLAVHAIKVH